MEKFVCILFVVILIASVIGDKYTTKYDNIDLDEILKSERLLKNYVDCLLGDGNCTPDGKELKEKIPDAMKTKCEKCSDKQKEGSRKVIRFLLKNKRPTFDKLAAMYDPEGTYLKTYKDELVKEGITI